MRNSLTHLTWFRRNYQMYHVLHKTSSTYPIAVLVKQDALEKTSLEKHYITPLGSIGDKAISFSLEYKKKKLKASEGREYLDQLLKALDSLSTKYLYVCDTEYFKLLTGQRKATGAIGYTFPCVVKGYEHMTVVLGVNYKQLFYDPSVQDKLDMSLQTLSDVVQGTYEDPGKGIIHSAQYPTDIDSISDFLDSLHQYPELSCDIETFSLKFWEAGIGTIAFAWDKHNGGAFAVDYRPINKIMTTGSHGLQSHNHNVKVLIRRFFEKYGGKITYHNANFDVKVLIYELYMDHELDNAGLINGLNTLGKNIDDTKIITYLATNSCAGNNLKLKDNAHEFAGNYAQDDIASIELIKLHSLLEYNLVDCLSTLYVKEKNYPIMVADQQLPIYQEIMLPSIVTLLQMELTGMPLDMSEVLHLQTEMSNTESSLHIKLQDMEVIKDFTIKMQEMECVKDNLLRERKPNSPPRPLEYYSYITFNPGSPLQLQSLMYEFLEYDVIDLTDTKQPATGAKTIKKLIHRSTCKEHTELFETLIELSEVSKILNTFVKAFIENSFKKVDGTYYLHGSFNLGGTVSGRLSSKQPNLQNIPSGSTYAKAIKKCFAAPPGWIMYGADFASLEDRISALTTKDPEKIKVYSDGYDGHSLRAFKYFGDQMPDIVDTIESINSISKEYPEVRQRSKAPTFLLTYQGTFHGLMENCGFSEREAKAIEKAYHELYIVSDEWVAEKLAQACKDGHVTVAFGLRVRTPVLAQTILNTSVTPFAAQSESRTAGNALGQSYGLLNNRACNEFRERLMASEYRNDIKIFAQIHDAIYGMVRNNLGATKWLNDNLPDCMRWQELPEIQHDEVDLSGEVDLFYPSWANAITLKNNLTIEGIFETVKEKR